MSRYKRLLPKRAFNLRLKKKTVYSIVQVTFFALAGLIVVSFSRQGSVLIRFNDLLLTLFSWSTVFLPFIFITISLMMSKIKTPLGQPNVVIGSILVAISAGSITRAGYLGRVSWESLVSLVTGPGAFLILVGVFLVGFVVLFNTSFDQVLTFIGRSLVGARRHLVGERTFKAPSFQAGLRVQGEVEPKTAKTQKTDQLLSQKLVSNIPGSEKPWEYPPLSLLADSQSGKADRGDIKANAGIIERTLESFGITARVVEVNLGPAVTQYAIEVALGTKLSKITTLERDLALALAAPTGQIRIEAPIPGRSLVGLELPNRSPEFVPLKKMLESDAIKSAKSKLTVALGLDVSGKSVVADLSKMPHVLIAGQTGSGKSVAINTFISCLLFRAAPTEVKLLLVDPKRVELTGYANIPHLLSPVIVDPDKVVSALKWVLTEMDRRYKQFAQAGVRNIDSFNEVSGFQALPYIVIVIDELADIMFFSPVEVEDAITRIAQMSRATGIHMILSTQRPSVNVVTGLIKANIPCRIAFAVSSQIDSRVILDSNGAEKLLGRGDMLYLPPDQAKPLRIQGAYVSDNDSGRVISFIREQGVAPQYTEEVTTQPVKGVARGIPGQAEERDELFEESLRIVCQYDRASASLLQRKLSIGYARAARILDQLEGSGVVSPSEGSKSREVLVKNPESFLSR